MKKALAMIGKFFIWRVLFVLVSMSVSHIVCSWRIDRMECLDHESDDGEDEKRRKERRYRPEFGNVN